MSQESSQWLNENTLIGWTSKRGNAWHYRASEQGAESNHYPLAVPTEDVERRLFNWKAEESPISFEVGGQQIVDPTRKGIVRPDTGTLLGVFRPGFQIHDYQTWLVEQTQMVADSDLGVSSAGLLKGGAVAWVQFELPETMEVAGCEFRPFITAATSLDGSLASTYQTGSQVVVCDNTLSAALNDKSHQIKIRHSSKSLGRIGEVRDALGLVYTVADDFMAEVEALTSTKVSDKVWARFLDGLAPAPKDGASARAAAMIERKRDALTRLYTKDERAAQWHGTAFGVLQAVNTYEQHEQHVRGMGRAERNALQMVNGEFAKADQKTMDLLTKVLA
jgi:phage/plasmid-like protein (TIGR03299 family)